MRTAVGDGQLEVDLAHSSLADEDVKYLVKLLNEAEAAASGRKKAAQSAQRAAERAQAEWLASSFDPFQPDQLESQTEREYREGCSVVWDDDDYDQRGGGRGGGTGFPSGFPGSKQRSVGEDLREVAAAPAEAPPSYRFTPRSQREGYTDGTKNVRHHRRGRAAIIFRHAMQRMTQKHKGLIAEAARLAIELEEGAAGCHHLSLQNNLLTSRGAAHLGSLIRTSDVLESLALGGNALGDTGAALLGRALQATRVLKTLAIQSCQVGPKGTRHLAGGLAHNRSLKHLWLFDNKAGDDGCAHLAGALRTCRLESLGLERNGVGKSGCGALAVVLPLERCPLMWLRLAHNASIGDDGVETLAQALRTNQSLTSLDLRSVGVGERGVKALAAAVKRSGTLRQLGVEDNGLPSSATEILLRAMQASGALKALSLDMAHGGRYERARTSDELRKELTLTFLGLGLGKDKEKERIAQQQGGATRTKLANEIHRDSNG